MSKIEKPDIELADALKEALEDDVHHLHGVTCHVCRGQVVATGAVVPEEDGGSFISFCGADVGTGAGWVDEGTDGRVCLTCSEIANETYRRHYGEEHT